MLNEKINSLAEGDPDHQTTQHLQKSSQRPPRRRKLPLLLLFTTLIIAVSLGGLYESHLLDAPSALKQPTPDSQKNIGNFIQLPLNPSQINAVRNLVSHMQYKQLASLYVSHMSLDEEIGQLIMVEYNENKYSADLATMIKDLHAGGVILYKYQMHTISQTQSDIARMQANANLPLFISTDEEGGWVDRLGNLFPFRPSASQIGASGNVDLATQEGHKAAQDMLLLGINNDMAPDVDIQLVAGPNELSRTYGTTADEVIKYAGAYMQALQSNGIVACIKHFPGLGAATIDAHVGLPVINRTRDQIYAVELAPYRAFIQAQNKLDRPGMIMPTDLLMPAIDPVYPAELSHIFMTDILRNEMGYDGVVLTDALYMDGISKTWSLPEASVLALLAGNDMLLGAIGSDQMIGVINGIKAALASGRLPKSRIDEAATRILALKMEYHLMPAVPPQA